MRVFLLCIVCLCTFCFSSQSYALDVRRVSVISTLNTEKIEARLKILAQVLRSSVFFPYTSERLGITVDHKLIEPRWRMTGRSITLSASIEKDAEFLKLFVHELAHFVDIYVLMWLWSKDPSKEFYQISWESSTTKRAWQKSQNFISGYAATNQYEDFAESFVFYVFHNRTFEDRALRDDIVRQKYLFFQNSVFMSWAFVDSDFSIGKVPSYIWDTTRAPISLQKYLYSLN